MFAFVVPSASSVTTKVICTGIAKVICNGFAKVICSMLQAA
jgi:hypothetical protein